MQKHRIKTPLLALFFCCVMLTTSGCETGHLWSMYSLGFTKRDAYLDNLADARDTMANIARDVAPVAVVEAKLAKEQRKVLNRADEALELFRAQLKTARRIGNSWLTQWQSTPGKFNASGYTAEQVSQDFSVLIRHANEIADQLHQQLRKPKATDVKALMQHIRAANTWVDAVNQHVTWLESGDSGYPINNTSASSDG